MKAAWELPKKRGPNGGIHNDDFNILDSAFDSYVTIKQIIAKTSGNNRKLLAQHINNAINTVSSAIPTSSSNDCKKSAQLTSKHTGTHNKKHADKSGQLSSM